jgi:hypothetical protein
MHATSVKIKKPAGYCSIIQFIHAHDKEGLLTDLLEQTCVERSLGDLRRKPGITFMWPTIETLNKVATLLQKDAKGAATACNILTAHILCDVYNADKPFSVSAPSPVNALIPTQTVKVKSATASSVVFECGAEAKLDTDFKQAIDPDSFRRQNLAVWRVVSGEIPVTVDQPGEIPKKPSRKGGYEMTAALSAGDYKLRYEIMVAIENEFAIVRSKGNINRNPYLEHLSNFIRFLNDSKEYRPHLFRTVLPMYSCSNLDLYLMLESHSFPKDPLIPTVVIEAWWKTAAPGPQDCVGLNVLVSELLDNPKAAADALGCSEKELPLIYKSPKARQDLLGDINKARAEARSKVSSNFRTSATEIQEIYEKFYKAQKNIYPAPVSVYYSDAKVKLAHDDLRFVARRMFWQLRSHFDINEYHTLVNLIGDSLKKKQPTLCHGSTVRFIQGSDAEQLRTVLFSFVASDYFLKIPMSSADFQKHLEYKSSEKEPAPGSKVVWTITKGDYEEHERLFAHAGPPKDHSRLIGLLKGMDLGHLPSEIAEEIKKLKE